MSGIITSGGGGLVQHVKKQGTHPSLISVTGATKVELSSGTLAITPTKATNKIKGHFAMSFAQYNGGNQQGRFSCEIRRGSTVIATFQDFQQWYNTKVGTDYEYGSFCFPFVDDTHGSTSALTYSIWCWKSAGGSAGLRTETQCGYNTQLEEVSV